MPLDPVEARVGLGVVNAFDVVRSVSIAAPPEKIYALVSSPRRWTLWWAWVLRDPEMTMHYEGPYAGQGAHGTWKSPTTGHGTVTFTHAQAPRIVGYELVVAEADTPSTGSIYLTPLGSQTRVVWTLHGGTGSSPWRRWMRVFTADTIGQDLDESLATLKKLAEKPS